MLAVDDLLCQFSLAAVLSLRIQMEGQKSSTTGKFTSSVPTQMMELLLRNCCTSSKIAENEEAIRCFHNARPAVESNVCTFG
mmetsp:Transcript_34114/g.70982  ORF Transcript_34114/g.70982 Transcript_34114/m.70982 type:complete len:82 (-) Transcript_34114:29-274(-)